MMCSVRCIYATFDAYASAIIIFMFISFHVSFCATLFDSIWYDRFDICFVVISLSCNFIDARLPLSSSSLSHTLSLYLLFTVGAFLPANMCDDDMVHWMCVHEYWLFSCHFMGCFANWVCFYINHMSFRTFHQRYLYLKMKCIHIVYAFAIRYHFWIVFAPNVFTDGSSPLYKIMLSMHTWNA